MDGERVIGFFYKIAKTIYMQLISHDHHPSMHSLSYQVTLKKHIMKAALKRGVETGTLVMVKSSYKVSAEAKKPVKAKKPIVAKVKKPVTKKVITMPVFVSSSSIAIVHDLTSVSCYTCCLRPDAIQTVVKKVRFVTFIFIERFFF